MTNKHILIYEKPEDWSSDAFVISTKKYVDAATALGWQTIPASYDRYDDNVNGIDDLSEYYSFVFGSIRFVSGVRSHLNPGVIGFMGAEKMSELMNAKRSSLFNDKMIMATWSNLHSNLSFYQNLFESEELFIRPDSGKKVFAGQTIKNQDDLAGIYQISSVVSDTIIGIAPAKVIKSEIRCFSIDYGVVETSFYNGSLNSESEQCDDLVNIATEFVNEWLSQNNSQICPDSSEVIDVAFDENYNPKILEINALSCSGLYMADANKILTALEPYFINHYLL